MSDDFYTDVARRRLQQIEAEEAQAQAHMIAARANGDTEYGTEQAEALEVLKRDEVRFVHILSLRSSWRIL
jgi:hypothetical protein